MYRYFIVLILLVLFNTPLIADKGKSVEYTVNNEKYEGYYSASGKNLPLVLLVHDWDGLTEYEKKRSDMLADMGYAVFAYDLFGKGIRPTKVADRRQHTGELYKNRDKMRKILNAGLKAAEKLGANVKQAVAMGYCFGGSAVLEMARSGTDLKGFVTFHGGLSTPKGQDYSKTKGFILVLHGAADTAITMADFAALNEELEAAKVQNEMIVYSGAPHAFTVFESRNYREMADKQSWKRFMSFLEETIQ